MKSSKLNVAALCCLLVVSVASCSGKKSSGGTAESSEHHGKSASGPNWEYQILGDVRNGFGETMGTSIEALDAAGAAGWEAIAVYGNGATLMKRLKD